VTQTLEALVADVGPPRAVDVAGLRERLEHVALGAVTGVDPALLPLRAPKDVLTKVLACEQHLVATQGSWKLSEPVVRGQVLDRLLHHHVHGERPGAADGRGALAVAEGAFEAERADDVTEWLLVHADERARLGEDATGYSDRLAAWGAIDPAWWPRCESSIRVDLAGARVVCTARLDLMLGGGPTERPLVLVEVKSGRFTQEHRDGLFWYAVVATLRYGQPPSAVVGWSALDGGGWCQPVNEALLESAVARGARAIELLGELARGRPPQRTACRACTWCPERDDCDAAHTSDDDD
jgi:hypothetical protein